MSHSDPQRTWASLIQQGLVDEQLARRLHPDGVPPMLWHECEDGHHWREQPDGGVSPGYALAGSSYKFPGWDPARCPEPDRIALPDDHGLIRGIRCPGCGAERLPWALLAGLSCTPWVLAVGSSSLVSLGQTLEGRLAVE